jgi:hypothetical protein
MVQMALRRLKSRAKESVGCAVLCVSTRESVSHRVQVVGAVLHSEIEVKVLADPLMLGHDGEVLTTTLKLNRGVWLLASEAGRLVARLRYSVAGQPAQQPPQ